MILKRIKRLVELSRKDPVFLEKLENMTQFEVDLIPEEKGEFIGEGTQKEFEEMEKADKGLKGIFGT